MEFKRYLEAYEQDSAIRSMQLNLEKALSLPEIESKVAELAAKDHSADAELVRLLEKILAGDVTAESNDELRSKLARKIADNLKSAVRGGQAVGSTMLNVTRAAIAEFVTEFLSEFSPERGTTATAAGVLGGMASRRVRDAWRKFRTKIPLASRDQLPQ